MRSRLESPRPRGGRREGPRGIQRSAQLLTTALIMGIGAAACSAQAPPVEVASSPFAEVIERLSEEPGYFDTDNLISNESSYLHVMDGLDALEVRGGAFIGVGPDQSFSYIARIRPELAVMIDVRRDNLLLHVLFKALFEEAANRLEYLALLYGRSLPASPEAWNARDVRELVEYIDANPTLPNEAEDVRRQIQERIATFGLSLDPSDLETLDRFHRAFIRPGLDLRFTSYGRAPRFFYPTHRDLVLAEDLSGEPASFLVREDDFQYLKRLQESDRVIPVVGNLAGDHALPEIGRLVDEMGLTVSALYTSNVEFYIWGDRGFSRFAETVSGLPTDERSVIIRSYFSGGAGRHPLTVPGFYSTQLLQRIADFRRVWQGEGFRSYGDLVTRDLVSLDPVSR